MRGPHFHLPLVAWCLDSGLSVPCFGSKDLSCNRQPCENKSVKKNAEEVKQMQTKLNTNSEEGKHHSGGATKRNHQESFVVGVGDVLTGPWRV